MMAMSVRFFMLLVTALAVAAVVFLIAASFTA